MTQQQEPIAIGAVASLKWQDGEECSGYYFSFGQLTEDEEHDEYGVPDTRIFYFVGEGKEGMDALMTEGVENFIVTEYELVER